MVDETNIMELMLRGEREWFDIVAIIGEILRKKKAEFYHPDLDTR